MQYEAKSEKQLQEEMCIPEGVYDFEVREAEETTSSKGSPMVALKLAVFDGNGNPRQQRDWLVGSPHPMCLRKIKHFCESVGLDYEAGQLEADACVGRSGLVQLAIEESADYGMQNKVSDYKTEKPGEKREKPRQGPTAAQQRKYADAPDEDIPF